MDDNPYQSPREGCEIDSHSAGRVKRDRTRVPYTADRAYRWSVLPLGIFMIVGGTVFVASAAFTPSQSMFVPPFQDPLTKRLVFGEVGLLFVPLGIGFCLRWKPAWWGFFAYALIGTTCSVVAGLTGPQDPRLAPAVFPPLINVPLLVAIYFATKPAFQRTPNRPR